MTTLNVPADLGEWLKDHENKFGNENLIFGLVNELAITYNSQTFHFKTRDFIDQYITEIWEVIAGERKYSIA